VTENVTVVVGSPLVGLTEGSLRLTGGAALTGSTEARTNTTAVNAAKLARIAGFDLRWLAKATRNLPLRTRSGS
jgi:hypothetical protein